VIGPGRSKPLTSGAKADGRFGKQDFTYLPDQDVYRCLAVQGNRLAAARNSPAGGRTVIVARPLVKGIE
jgi:hypothetical protein